VQVVTAPSTPKTRAAFCSAISSESGEPVAATASRVDHWVLVEDRGAWARRDPLAGSFLPPEVKEHLTAQVAALPNARLLFVKGAHSPYADGRVFLARSRPGEERFFELAIERSEDLLAVDFAQVLAGSGAVAEPLFLVCTHGKRDRCCALNGRPLYDALRDGTDPGRVWQSTHVGGDRFAGNVVVLPHGLYYGRVAPADVGRLLEATGAGKVDLEHYRGRSAYPMRVQAAEHALRESTGLLGIDDLELVESARGEDGSWRVRFRTPDAALHDVNVVESLADEPMLLTCESAEPRRARHWRVTALS
jgi:hypothetical protein